jgi:ABC-type transporter Mla subunit MlaD
MGSPFVQLAEEAALRTTEFASRAEAGATAAGDVIEQAEALGTHAIEEARSVHSEYQEAIAAIRHAAEQAREAAGEARRAVLSVPEATQKTGTAVESLLAELHTEIREMGELRVRSVQTLSDSAKQAEAEFHDLSLQVQELVTQLESHLKEAGSHVERVQQVLESAGTQIETARQSIKDALLDLGKVAGGTTGDVGHVLEQVTAAASHGIVDFCNNAIRLHNDLTAAVRTGYVDETETDPDPDQTWVEPAFKTLHDAIAGFAQLLSPAETVLMDTVSTILAEGEKAVSSLDAVALSLRQAVPEGHA